MIEEFFEIFWNCFLGQFFVLFETSDVAVEHPSLSYLPGPVPLNHRCVGAASRCSILLASAMCMPEWCVLYKVEKSYRLFVNAAQMPVVSNHETPMLCRRWNR